MQVYKKVKAMNCALAELPSRAKPFRISFQPIFSLDNASVHKAAVKDPKWLLEHPWIISRLKLTCYSGAARAQGGGMSFQNLAAEHTSR